MYYYQIEPKKILNQKLKYFTKPKVENFTESKINIFISQM